jgi:hypothetical protein
MRPNLQQELEREQDTVPKAAPQTTPPRSSIGLGHPEYNFVQGLMELNGSVSRMQAVLEQVKQSSDDTKAKVARMEKIIYAAGVVAVLAVGVVGWMLNTAKDVGMLYYKTMLEAQLKAPSPQPPAKGGK